MFKYPNEPNSLNTQLPLVKNAQTENEQSQSKLFYVPNEILVEILEYLTPSEISRARRVSKWFDQVIMSEYHGPCLRGFNHYLNLFPDNTKNAALTYPVYLKKLEVNKDSFLKKQFSEIKAIQKNLTDCVDWSNVSHDLQEEILNISEKSISYTEAKKREALLDDVHIEVIKSKINLQLQTLNLASLNLTRFPKALFTDRELQEFWQALEILSLRDNQLTELPVEIGVLQMLEILSIGDNQLTSLPAEIGGLRSLVMLSLRNNQLTSLPVEVSRLQALTALFFDSNQLTSLPVEICGLRMLEGLYLSNNQLASLPAEIGGLQVLRRLFLQNNQLTTLPKEVGELQELVDLSLNNNHLTSETIRQVGQRFGENYVQKTLETQTYPDIAQVEDLSNRNSPRS